MNRTTVKTLAAASILALSASVLAACSSSNSSSTPKAASSATGMGKPMVIVDNVGQVFNKTFNPYLTSSLGVTMNMQDLTYEPLLMFNMMQPTQAPIPWLASAYTWSDGGKTLTLTTRPGIKWSDGKPFSAADVAFTFNLLMKNPTLSSPAPNPKPQYASLFLIGSTYILPQHIWQGVSNPATYADANPVGTGPYVLSSFSTQKVVFTANPTYWQKSMVHVPEIIFPNYVSNDTSNPALFNGQIDYAGNNVSNVATNYLGKSTDNHTWTSSPPYFADNNVVGLFLNVTTPPLNDVNARPAISAGISRQQLSVQGETGYEPAATSSSGLMLPTDNALLSQAYANDLPATGNAAKVSQLLTSDGYAKVGGKWMKNGQPIKFSIEDPSAYTDYATDAQLIATQLNTLGFEVSFDGVQATQWYIDYPNGHFDAMIHWGAQGPNPYFYFQDWLDNTLSAPIGKTAGGDWERFTSPQAQAALSQFEGTNDTATQQQALNTLQGILSTQAPVIPLLYGAAWYEYSTKHYTGWPTADNQYNNPVPNSPYILNTVLHLKPVS